MQSITAMRITVGSLAALLTGAIAYGIHAGDEAQALRAQLQPAIASGERAVVPQAERDDDGWSAEGWEGEEGWRDRADGGGIAGEAWRLVLPDGGGDGVQPAPSRTPESRAS